MVSCHWFCAALETHRHKEARFLRRPSPPGPVNSESADEPAKPRRPQHVARKVRAPGDLRAPEGQARQAHPSQPEAADHRPVAPPQEVAAQEGERGDRVARGKAVARPAVRHGPAPMRHVGRNAAELLQIPRAAREAGALESGNQQQADERGAEPAHAFGAGRPRREGANRVDRHEGQQRAGKATPPFVKQRARQPCVAPGKAAGIAEPAGNDEVEPAELPAQQCGEPEHGDDGVMPLAPGPPAHRLAAERLGSRQECSTSHSGSYCAVRTSSIPSTVWKR